MTRADASETLPETLPKGQATVLTIQWVAMIGACAAMTGVAAFVGPEAAAASDPEAAALMLPLLGALGLGALGVSLFAGGPLARAMPAFLTWMILRWALTESVTVFGLVMAFTGVDLQLALAFCALGALGLLLQPANAAAYERYRRDRLAARR